MAWRTDGWRAAQTAIQTAAAIAVLGVAVYGIVVTARGEQVWRITAKQAQTALERTTADTTKVISEEARKTRDVLVALLVEIQKLRAGPSPDPIEPCPTPDSPGYFLMIPRSQCLDRAALLP